jgi:hypothetical protein
MEMQAVYVGIFQSSTFLNISIHKTVFKLQNLQILGFNYVPLFCLGKDTKWKCQLHCFETQMACDYKLQSGEPIFSSKIKTVSVYAKCPFCHGAHYRMGREGKK